MTTLDQLKHLRAHLLRNWNYAQDWIHNSVASNGAPCFIFALNSPTGNFTEINRAMGSSETGAYFAPFYLLHNVGKDGLLREFDRAIARLEEHEEVGEPELLPELVAHG